VQEPYYPTPVLRILDNYPSQSSPFKTPNPLVSTVQDEFEDTKGVIRIYK